MKAIPMLAKGNDIASSHCEMDSGMIRLRLDIASFHCEMESDMISLILDKAPSHC